MQSASNGFQANVEDRVAVRGFQQSSASPITDRDKQQDTAILHSPTVPQSALAARLKDSTSPVFELKDARNSGSLGGAEQCAQNDKNKVRNIPEELQILVFCFKI